MEKKKIVDVHEVKKVVNLGPIVGDGVAHLIMSALRFNKLNEKYSNISHLKGLEFLSAAMDTFEITYEVNPEELKRIPRTGAFISVSNHPFGGVDGMILIKMMLEQKRNDIKTLSNFIIQRIPQIAEFVFPVDPFDNGVKRGSNLIGLKKALTHVSNGGALGLFPAGEVSTYYDNMDEVGVVDRQWQPSMIKFIKRAGVPVVPIYFQGEN
ncbi:MAG TPA: 1-acyl-sn-glycerol-3-phosphate acyltransferase, partial [Tenuifilaceae bacterium]|nr:1-acyl-sn-glycerol-3-phosphate acyltransferase [Tenuifilaceae bacterium]